MASRQLDAGTITVVCLAALTALLLLLLLQPLLQVRPGVGVAHAAGLWVRLELLAWRVLEGCGLEGLVCQLLTGACCTSLVVPPT